MIYLITNLLNGKKYVGHTNNFKLGRFANTAGKISPSKSSKIVLSNCSTSAKCFGLPHSTPNIPTATT
ncbi:MAG: hypothetical protein IKN16_12475 [Selenomonadaceae bacterium]|nr:hypothetical protein [Selenomonadaceae bacterium]MBR6889238.1 hypothetical protein [Selenomonadaceae bacterium]